VPPLCARASAPRLNGKTEMQCGLQIAALVAILTGCSSPITQTQHSGPFHPPHLEHDEQRSMDEAGDARLRVVAKPEKPLAQLLIRLGIELPSVPKVIEKVVPKIT